MCFDLCNKRFRIADVVAWKYNKVTPFEKKSNKGVANAIRVGSRKKIDKLISKMKKLFTVTNLVHGLGFFEEV